MSSSRDEVKINRIGPVMSVTPSGELDLVTAPGLADVLRHAADGTVAEVRVVLSEVTFMDSTGLDALLCGWQAALAAGVRFQVTDASPAVRRVLTVTGTDRLFYRGEA
jgi:anti-sigma B factor antagonist